MKLLMKIRKFWLAFLQGSYRLARWVYRMPPRNDPYPTEIKLLMPSNGAPATKSSGDVAREETALNQINTLLGFPGMARMVSNQTLLESVFPPGVQRDCYYGGDEESAQIVGYTEEVMAYLDEKLGDFFQVHWVAGSDTSACTQVELRFIAKRYWSKVLLPGLSQFFKDWDAQLYYHLVPLDDLRYRRITLSMWYRRNPYRVKEQRGESRGHSRTH